MFKQLIENCRAVETTPASDLALVARRFLEGGLNRFTALARYEASLDRQYRNAWRALDSRAKATTEICANEAAAETSRTNPMCALTARNTSGWKSRLRRISVCLSS